MTERKGRPGVAGQGDAQVVSITTRTAGRVGYKRLASAQVANARARLGMTAAEYARYLTAELGWPITAEMVEYWEDGDSPPGEVLLASAAAVGGTLEFPSAEGPGGAEVRPYAGRGLITREQWNGIIGGRTDHVWLYGMAEFGYATDDEVPEILTAAAEAGCDVRVLLLDPGCPAAASVDADEGSPPGTLPARIRAALARFIAMRRDCPGIEVRIYDTHPTVSIVRGDGEMLVTPYLRYFLGSNSPTFALTADSAPGMFGRYERHFESMWRNSRGAD
jgi:DNA-binding transcriptional regulator YiaG